MVANSRFAEAGARMNRRDFLKSCSVAAMAAGVPWAAAAPEAGRRGNYVLGADISWVPEDEAAGAVYYDRGVKKDIFEILPSYGFNFIRLRVFNDPKAAGGYAARQSEAFCDVAHTVAMAKRAKAAGMGVLVTCHLGDTWTSPGKQAKPAAWADLDFAGLEKAVHAYVQRTVTALADAGVMPEMMGVGNETSDGCLFPDGRKSDGAKFAALIQAGCSAVRDADKKVQIMLHHHQGRTNEAVVPWVDNFLSHGVDFDIIGMSCYNEARPGDWKKNFDDLAVRYPKLTFAAAEYSYKKRELNDLIFHAPNGKGIGSFIWEPTRWREAIFDKDGLNAGNDDNNKPHLKANPIPGTEGMVPTTAPATQTAAGPGGMRRRNGGRYDTNAYILKYPEMAKAYGNI
jgi:arabinogalactan endo-1,4-beta-galactosidase